jgi:hypothetical protein
MLTDSTKQKIDSGLSRLRAAQAQGTAPQPGEITTAMLADICGVSKATMRQLENLALQKAYAALKAAGLPAHLANKPTRFDHLHHQP